MSLPPDGSLWPAREMCFEQGGPPADDIVIIAKRSTAVLTANQIGVDGQPKPIVPDMRAFSPRMIDRSRGPTNLLNSKLPATSTLNLTTPAGVSPGRCIPKKSIMEDYTEQGNLFGNMDECRSRGGFS